MGSLSHYFVIYVRSDSNKSNTLLSNNVALLTTNYCTYWILLQSVYVTECCSSFFAILIKAESLLIAPSCLVQIFSTMTVVMTQVHITRVNIRVQFSCLKQTKLCMYMYTYLQFYLHSKDNVVSGSNQHYAF
jgi:hypothetical protein